MTIQVELVQIEPGKHICRKDVATLSVARYEIPDAECREERPDWGEYRPVVTFPAIERALRARGYLPWVGENYIHRFGIAKA